jgi:hypothetical protein
MNPTAPENDPIRTKIVAAMDRLLAGTPLRSTGRLSVSQLAVEAGVGRWHLTHQHIDLKDQFQARVASTENTPAAFTRRLGEFENLKVVHAKLVAHCADLEERLQVYATVINVLSLQKQAANTTTARVADIHNRRRCDR